MCYTWPCNPDDCIGYRVLINVSDLTSDSYMYLVIKSKKYQYQILHVTSLEKGALIEVLQKIIVHVLRIHRPLFETMASALDSAAGSVLPHEDASAYANHVQLFKQPRGKASLSRIQSRSRGFKKGHSLIFLFFL